MSELLEILDSRLSGLEQEIESIKKSNEAVSLLTEAITKLNGKEYFDKSLAKDISASISKAIGTLKEGIKQPETKIDLSPIVELVKELKLENKKLSDTLLKVTSEKTDNSDLVNLLVGMIQKQNDLLSKQNATVPEYNDNLKAILQAITRPKLLKFNRNRHSDEIDTVSVE